MHPGAIQHQKGWSANLQGHYFQFIADELGVYIRTSRSEMALVVTTNEAKAVDFCPFFGWDKDLFARKLPPVGHIAFRTNMAFIPIKKVY